MTAVKLAELIGIEHSIIQAPMAGGTTTPELVAAVSNAGALGSLGAAYLAPQQIAEAIAEIRRLTGRPFCVNLFVPPPAPEPGSWDADAVLAFLSGHQVALGLPPPGVPTSFGPDGEGQWAAVLAERVPVFSFTLGVPDPALISRFQAGGTRVLGTATTVAEARTLADVGVDGVVAQGSEAGAHRATFAAGFEESLVGTIALVPQVVDAVDVPVIASGGIMDGRGIVAAEALGAAGVQLGTAFLTTHEAGTSAAYRNAVLRARDDQTVITRAFSGRPARGIVNSFIRQMSAPGAPEPLPFPVHNALTGPMRRAAAQQNDADRLALWAGQGAPLARAIGAGELVQRLVTERASVLRQLTSPRPHSAWPRRGHPAPSNESERRS
jgi:nitronate monooxygenase